MEFQEKDPYLDRVVSLTRVLKYPEQRIYTFGDTDFKYIVVSSNPAGGSTLRSGALKCKSPVIVTPETFLETFRGFSEESVDFAKKRYGDIVSKIRVLGYQFSHIPQGETPYAENARQLAHKAASDISATGDDTAVLLSPEDLWSTSLVKIMFDILKKSVGGNYNDFKERGYFLSEEEKIRNEIEILFAEAAADKQYIDELALRLREYDLFEKYEDRFFQLVR